MGMNNDPVVKMRGDLFQIFCHLVRGIFRLSEVQGFQAAFKHFGNQTGLVGHIPGGRYYY